MNHHTLIAVCAIVLIVALFIFLIYLDIKLTPPRCEMCKGEGCAWCGYTGEVQR